MAKRGRWITFYIDDYHADTEHLGFEEHAAYILLLHECWRHGSIPMDPRDQARILKISLYKFQKIWPVISKFFDADGRNKRATKERAKAEAVSLRRSVSGEIGGRKSGMIRTIAAAMAQKNEANWQANREAKQASLLKQGAEALKVSKKESKTVREVVGGPEPLVDNVDNLPAPALATALCDGALAPGPAPEQAEPKRLADKKPSELTKAELDQLYAKRREDKANPQPAAGAA
jgi:uncharacterized protein YdaU (DUF1376 family)